MALLRPDHVSEIIGIVDSDFGRVDARFALSADILDVIVSDDHDLICMMCRSPAFTRVVNEFIAEGRLQRFEAGVGCSFSADLIAARLLDLAAMRLASLQNGWGFDFDGLQMRDCVDDKTLEIGAERLISLVRDRSKRHDIGTGVIMAELARIRGEGHKLWEMVCGHDVLELLSHACRKTIGNQNASDVSAEKLQRALRLAYTPGDFASSKLSSGLSLWQSERGHKLLLDS